MNYSDVYRIFFHPAEVTEIRAYGLSGKNKGWAGFARGAGIVYGYYNDPEAFGRDAEALDNAKAPGIYFVLNPVDPNLLARANNRLKAADMKSALTSDKNVLFYRWIYLDLDPVRPTEISSTDEELKEAIKMRNAIHKYVGERFKHKKCIAAVSGNGAHLMIRINDMPPNDANERRVQNILRFFDSKFSTDKVKVDTGVYNPARICKLYGTVARKGDSIPDFRPHRRSYIEKKFLDSMLMQAG